MNLSKQSLMFPLVFVTLFAGLPMIFGLHAVRAQSSTTQSNSEPQSIKVSVLDNKWNFIRDLTADDFKLTVDGTRQQITSVEEQSEVPLNLSYLIDVSGSQEPLVQQTRSVALWSLQSVWRQGTDDGAVSTFSETVSSIQPWTRNGRQLQTAIEGIIIPPKSAKGQKANGSSAKSRIWDSVAFVCEQPNKGDDRADRVMVLITDGNDNSDHMNIDKAVEAAIRNKVTIVAIAIATNTGSASQIGAEASLSALTERTGGRVYFPAKGDDLTTMFLGINKLLRTRYQIIFQPSNDAHHNGVQKLKLEVTNANIRKRVERILYPTRIFFGQ
jgi:VWFA-related protein